MLVLPQSLSKACGPGTPPFSGYSVLNPALINPDSYAPFLIDLNVLQRYYQRQSDSLQIKDNVYEWYERFCKEVRLKDIRTFVYRYKISDLRQLKTVMRSPSLSLPSYLRRNDFARHLYRNECIEPVDYLLFAKSCEKYVVAGPTWERSSKDKPAMQRLIDAGKDRLINTESHYIRLRYAFQIIRLAHYMKDYRQALELYDWAMPKIDNDPSLIEGWIESLRAGALQWLGKEVESAYIFSKVFADCPSKRKAAWLSFKVSSDANWEKLLLRCETDEERAVLHVIRAAKQNSRLLEEMQAIYELDPTNKDLRNLLLRELRRLEKDLLGLPFNDMAASNKRNHGIPRKGAGDRVIALQEFVRKVIDDNQTNEPELWQTAEAYLELLAGDYYFAQQSLKEARELTPKQNKALLEQQEALNLALQISSWEVISDSIEIVAQRIRNRDDMYNRYEDFTDFLDDKMALLFRKSGQEGLAFLLDHKIEDLRSNPQPDLLTDLLRLVRQDKHNAYEKTLITAGDSIIEREILNQQATMLMAENQYVAALDVYKEIGRTNWDDYGVFTPFYPRSKDCVKCPIPADMELYNRGTLLEKLIDMNYQAQTTADRAESASLYFQLGVAEYNMSYFGNAWKAKDMYRSGQSIADAYRYGSGPVFSHPSYPYGNREQFDLRNALRHFEKVIEISPDPNLAARAAFWAAKCEQNNYFVYRKNDHAYSQYFFRLLQEQYSETPYYQRAVKECVYLRRFVQNTGDH